MEPCLEMVLPWAVGRSCCAQPTLSLHYIARSDLSDRGECAALLLELQEAWLVRLHRQEVDSLWRDLGRVRKCWLTKS